MHYGTSLAETINMIMLQFERTPQVSQMVSQTLKDDKVASTPIAYLQKPQIMFPSLFATEQPFCAVNPVSRHSLLKEFSIDIASQSVSGQLNFTSFPYKPLDNPMYRPTLESSQQLGRISMSIRTYGESCESTTERYQLMHAHYTSLGGKKTMDQFQSKIIEDLLFLIRKHSKKPKYNRNRN